jgi:membrane associated rhomboid family serine protease
MMMSGLGFMFFKGQDLLLWGANYRPTTTDGEWWRLLSSTFLHGGFIHLFFNMYGLLFVGLFLEPVLGKTKFLILYLMTGILSSLTSVLWYEATISVGASGAIFGMYGLFLAFMLTRIYHPDFSKSFLLSTVVFVAFNLLMGLTGGIDNAAHIGGLVSGFIVGLILTPILKNEE